MDLQVDWHTLGHVVETIGPALAAYVSVRVGLARAITTAELALKTAQRAHARIDNHMTQERG